MINTGQQDSKIQWSRAVPAGAGDEGMEAGEGPAHWRAEVAVMQQCRWWKPSGEINGLLSDTQEVGREVGGFLKFSASE